MLYDDRELMLWAELLWMLFPMGKLNMLPLLLIAGVNMVFIVSTFFRIPSTITLCASIPVRYFPFSEFVSQAYIFHFWKDD